jgi:hypothetical protein
MRFITDKNSLTIELTRREQIRALKAKIKIEKSDVADVNFKELFKDWRNWEVRLTAAGLPGRLVAGSYWTEEGWDFLYLRDPHGLRRAFVHNVLCIETNKHKYKRIIVSCSKKEAKKIIVWAKIKDR